MEILYLCHPLFNNTTIGNITDAYSKFIRKDDKRKSDSAGTGLTCITSLAAYEAYLLLHRKPEVVLIQPELHWADQNTKYIYFGYDRAIDLLARRWPARNFDLQFVTDFDQAKLMAYANPEHRKLISTFRHNTPDHPVVLGSPFSPLHFELMRKINTEDITRLRIIRHQLIALQSDIERDDEASASKFLRLSQAVSAELDDLKTFDIKNKQSISRLAAECSNVTDPANLLLVVKKAVSLINAYEKNDSEDTKITAKAKALYKVLILEDKGYWLRGLSTTLQQFFADVNPSSRSHDKKYDLPDFWKNIRQFKDIDLFIVDLIFLDKNDHYYPFNGLDLYAAIRKFHPYAVIRVISSLPRTLISDLVQSQGLSLQLKEFIPKRDGLKTVQALLEDRAVDLIAECSRMEKKKNASFPVPRQGFFGWPGVQSWLSGLIHEQPDEYLLFEGRAMQLFRNIRDGREIDLAVDWENGELPSGHMADNFDEDYLRSKIVAIMTHRLLVIDFALGEEDEEIDVDSYISERLTGYRNKKTSGTNKSKKDGGDTQYLNKIGIEKEANGREHPRLLFQHLFAHEYKLVASALNKKDPEAQKKLITRVIPVAIWFKDLLASPQVHDNWKTLGLNFNPFDGGKFVAKTYNSTTKTNSRSETLMIGDYQAALEGLTIAHLLQFMQVLIQQATKEEAQAIIAVVQHKYRDIKERHKWPKALLMYARAFCR